MFELDVEGEVAAGMEITVEWEYDDGDGRTEVKNKSIPETRKLCTAVRFVDLPVVAGGGGDGEGVSFFVDV